MLLALALMLVDPRIALDLRGDPPPTPLRRGVRIIAGPAGLTPPGARAYFPDPPRRREKDDRREAYLPTQSYPSPAQARLPCPDEDEGWPEDARSSSLEGP